jgi:DNA-binding transcriptional LysR family regulator
MNESGPAVTKIGIDTQQPAMAAESAGPSIRERTCKAVCQYLRYMMMAAEKGSFRQAAIELGIWESTISRGIRDLEDEIGVALFIRHPGGVELTNAGRRFLSHARMAIACIEYALKDAGAAGRGEVGMVRIGIFTSLASGFLADLLQAYQAENLYISLDLVEGGPAEHASAVKRHRIDVAFLTGNPIAQGCETTHLWKERVFVVLPQGHDLAKQEEIGWNDLRNEHFIVSEVDPGPEIHDYLVKHLAELGHHPNVERCGVGRDNLMQLVVLGRGLSLTSEATTAAIFPGVVYRPLKAEKLPFCAVWSLHNDNPAFRRLMSMARTLSKRAAAGGS